MKIELAATNGPMLAAFVYQDGAILAVFEYPPQRKRNRLLLQGSEYAITSLTMAELTDENLPAAKRRDFTSFKAPNDWRRTQVPFIPFHEGQRADDGESTHGR